MNAQSASGAPRLLSPLRATALFMAVMVAAPHAQVLQGTVARAESTPAAAAADPEVSQVQLLVGHSTVVNVGQAITRVSLTSPTIADAMVTAPQQLLVHGKAPGSISLFVWDRAGGIKRFAVNVQRDLSALQHQVKTLFPGEPISVYGNGKDVVVAGTVSSKYVIEKAAEVAAGYVEKKEDVVNLLKQEEGLATQQVLLRVRFAEVSRNAMTELGVSMFANGLEQGRWFGRVSTDQVPGPDFVADQSGTKMVFSDFLNLFLFDAKNNVGAVVRALQNKGLFQSLAEPNLIAENGKEASFLAGGEYPYPVVQGGGDRAAVTIVFKEFGIKLNFTPTIVGGDLVKLKVRPEVSSLDFANAIMLEGFRVPAISTRRTETEVELRDGQTFAIAGLMNNTVTSTMSKIPGIGDIPILGLLFRSKAAQKSQTELVVMITPQILRRNSTGVSSALPNIVEPYLGAPKKSMPQPAPWSPGEPPQSAVQPSTQPAAQPAMQPAAPPPAPPVRAEAPVAVRPEAAPSAPEPETVAVAPMREPEPIPVAEPQPAVAPEASTAVDVPVAPPGKLTKEQKAAIERAAKEEKALAAKAAKQAEKDRKLAAEQARRDAKLGAERAERERKVAAEQARADAKRAAAEKKEAERAAGEQGRLEAEIQARQAEAAKKQAVVDAKRAEELARAEQKLKDAQREYQSALGSKQ